MEELNKKQLKSTDQEHINIMIADVKSMYQTSLLRTATMKLQYTEIIIAS